MNIEHLKTLKSSIKDAKDIFKKDGRDAIQEEVKNLLSQSDIKSVGWAAKSGEYNDEGMYPGVVGPFINMDKKYRSLAYESSASKDIRIKTLKQIIDTLGEDVLTNLFGEEAFVIASLNKENKVCYTTESLRY